MYEICDTLKLNPPNDVDVYMNMGKTVTYERNSISRHGFDCEFSCTQVLPAVHAKISPEETHSKIRV